jgi:drug/metabolite transporter (DMT)-like permease
VGRIGGILSSFAGVLMAVVGDGVGTFFGGILVTPFIGLTPDDPAVSMTVCMAVAALLALVVAVTMTRSRKTIPAG